jgi:hypothetical protein
MAFNWELGGGVYTAARLVEVNRISGEAEEFYAETLRGVGSSDGDGEFDDGVERIGAADSECGALQGAEDGESGRGWGV